MRRQTWEELRAGARPLLLNERAEPGEWQHGWRRWYLLRRALLTRLTCAFFLAPSSAVLQGAPTGPEFKLTYADD